MALVRFLLVKHSELENAITCRKLVVRQMYEYFKPIYQY